MSIYDYQGNEISGSGGGSDIKQAFLELVASGEINLGSQIGATLAYNTQNLNEAWHTNAEIQYNAMKAKYKELANYAIPFFISTDQHNGYVEQHRWANNIDKDGINFMNINLGDTVQSVYSETTLDSVLARTKQVKNYVGVVGNHDANNPDGQPSVYDLTRYFFSNYSRVNILGDSDSYSFVDGEHRVHCIVSDQYLRRNGTYSNDVLSSAYCDWLISELSRDKYDIVFIQHWMIYATRGTYKYRDGTAQSTDNIGGPPPLRTILADRKARRGGSITDENGGTHSYDFSNCKHTILCCLHGHQHEEIWAKLDGVLCYAADWFGNNRLCTFGIIDRLNNKLHIWKWTNQQTYALFSMDL